MKRSKKLITKEIQKFIIRSDVPQFWLPVACLDLDMHKEIHSYGLHIS